MYKIVLVLDHLQSTSAGKLIVVVGIRIKPRVLSEVILMNLVEQGHVHTKSEVCRIAVQSLVGTECNIGDKVVHIL